MLFDILFMLQHYVFYRFVYIQFICNSCLTPHFSRNDEWFSFFDLQEIGKQISGESLMRFFIGNRAIRWSKFRMHRFKGDWKCHATEIPIKNERVFPYVEIRSGVLSGRSKFTWIETSSDIRTHSDNGHFRALILQWWLLFEENALSVNLFCCFVLE